MKRHEMFTDFFTTIFNNFDSCSYFEEGQMGAVPDGIDKPKTFTSPQKSPETEKARVCEREATNLLLSCSIFFFLWTTGNWVLVWSQLKRRQAKLLAAKVLTGWSSYLLPRTVSV